MDQMFVDGVGLDFTLPPGIKNFFWIFFYSLQPGYRQPIGDRVSMNFYAEINKNNNQRIFWFFYMIF